MSQEINGYLLREQLGAAITLGASGAIGTAAATVDVVSHVGVIATVAGLTFTLPLPADTRSGRDFRITNKGAIPFAVGSKTIGANDYADFSFDAGVWHNEARQKPSDFNLQDLLSLNGYAHVSKTGQVRWSNRFITMTAGGTPQEPNGYHDITMPADGAVIQHSDGTTRVVAAPTAGDELAKGGVQLNTWETLWYRIGKGTGAGSVVANFRITFYTNNASSANGLLGINGDADTSEWIRICSRDDTNHFRWGTGDTVGFGGLIGTDAVMTSNYYSAMKQRVMGDGYFFSPAGNTAIPVAFGFTGTIRWIDGGAQGYTSGNGYQDVGNRAAGTIVYNGSGGANRTWRLMTAAEKPGWFGGALRSTNAIVVASSTVVDLNDNEVLCFIPTPDGAAGGSWYVFNYTGSGSVLPVHALPVASRQATGGNTTIQVLLGGVQAALKAGDAVYSSVSGEHFADASRRKITHKGIKHCRWAHAGIFSGAAANGNVGAGPDGLMFSWDDNTMMYGISDGYASWGTQYAWLNVPTAGAQIPVVTSGSNATRVVQVIGGKRFIPLAPWEALYWIPPAYIGGTSSADGDWVVGWYGTNHYIPQNAIAIAKYEAALSPGSGSTGTKTRVLFADGTYMQPGFTRPASAAVAALYDTAHNSGEWRNVTVAGSTPPGGSAVLPAVAGVQGNYPAQYVMQYRNLTNDDDPRGYVEIKGLIALNANITAASPNIAFIPGAQVYGEPIHSVIIAATTQGDNKMITAQVRLINGVLGNQNGFFVRAEVSSFNTAVNPYYSLGLNGGNSPAGTPQWVSFDSIGRIPCA